MKGLEFGPHYQSGRSGLQALAAISFPDICRRGKPHDGV